MNMDNDEQTAYIVHHLSEGDDPNDLIFEICQRFNISWSEAENLVIRVQTEKEQVIARKQFPLLFVLAFAIFVGGLALIGYSIFIYAGEYSLLQAAPENGRRTMENIDIFQKFLAFLGVMINGGGSTIYAFFLGIAMVLGSLIGMRNAWSKILN
jgi:hypothetical protein